MRHLKAAPVGAAVQRAADRLGLPGRRHPGRPDRLRQRGHGRRPAQRRRQDRPRRPGHRAGQRAVHPPGHHGDRGRRHQRRPARTTGSTPPTTTGPDQLVQTIEANFGIPIEHVVQLNFVGFRGAVDAIGGVNLDFPYPAKDAYTGLDITSTGLPAPERRLLAGRGPQPALPVLRGRLLAVRRHQRLRPHPAPERLPEGAHQPGREAVQPADPQRLHRLGGPGGDRRLDLHGQASWSRWPSSSGRFASTSLATATLPDLLGRLVGVRLPGSVLYVQQPQADPGDQPVPRWPGPGAADPAARPLRRGVDHDHHVDGTRRPPIVGREHAGRPRPPAVTTTTIETDFDPTPC